MSGALIAMSGGVDSSVAALLTARQGLDCAGSMMVLHSSGDAEDARAVAHKLNIPFYISDFSEAFNEHVIKQFVRAYEMGETPNPCVLCNRYLKFGMLLERARELGRDCVVTGHYARIERVNSSGRYLLKKGADASKDQSYMLYALTQEQLRLSMFPLGAMTKAEVREIAAQYGFANANKRDSQDICFVPNGSYAEFIRSRTGNDPQRGRFVDVNGSILGEHKGIIYYTIGQRKGLGISAAEPLYVCDIFPESNTVVLGSEDRLFARVLTARNINLIPFDRLDKPIKVQAKARYKQPAQSASVCQIDADTLRVEFDAPQRALTKGQAVVLYDGDIVIGGGTISGVSA